MRFWAVLVPQRALSNRIPTNRCRFATADRPGQDRESSSGACCPGLSPSPYLFTSASNQMINQSIIKVSRLHKLVQSLFPFLLLFKRYLTSVTRSLCEALQEISSIGTVCLIYPEKSAPGQNSKTSLSQEWSQLQSQRAFQISHLLSQNLSE